MTSQYFVYDRPVRRDEIRQALKADRLRQVLFVRDVHSVSTVDHTSGMFNTCEPRVICTPMGSGATTELNYIACLFDGFPAEPATKGYRRFVIPSEARGWSRSVFAEWLATRLESKQTITMAHMMRESRFVQRFRYSLMCIDGLGRLRNDSLFWLLANVQELQGGGATQASEHRLQLVLAGSLTLKALTRDWNSPIDAVAEVGVRDFTPDEMARTLLPEQGEPALSAALVASLRRLTAGDKYYVQMLLAGACRVARDRGAKGIAPTDLDAVAREYVLTGYRKDSRAQRVLKALSSCPAAMVVVKTLIRRENAVWPCVAPDAKKILYDMGIVRVAGSNASFHSELMRDLVRGAVGRGARTAAFLVATGSSNRLLPATARRSRAELGSFLSQVSLKGELVWAYYVQVVSRARRGLRVHFTGVDGDEHLGYMDGQMFADVALEQGQGFLMYCLHDKKGPVVRFYFDKGTSRTR